jgi:hypothetical protein
MLDTGYWVRKVTTGLLQYKFKARFSGLIKSVPLKVRLKIRYTTMCRDLLKGWNIGLASNLNSLILMMNLYRGNNNTYNYLIA